MNPVLRWILLAIFATLLTCGAAVASFIHSSAAEDLAAAQDASDSQPEMNHHYTLAARWRWVAVAAELLSFMIWMKVAQVWNRRSPTKYAWLRYALMVVVSIATPCALMALFFVAI